MSKLPQANYLNVCIKSWKRRGGALSPFWFHCGSALSFFRFIWNQSLSSHGWSVGMTVDWWVEMWQKRRSGFAFSCLDKSLLQHDQLQLAELYREVCLASSTVVTEVSSLAKPGCKLLPAPLRGGERIDITEILKRNIRHTVAGFNASTVNTELPHLQALETHVKALHAPADHPPILRSLLKSAV